MKTNLSTMSRFFVAKTGQPIGTLESAPANFFTGIDSSVVLFPVSFSSFSSLHPFPHSSWGASLGNSLDRTGSVYAKCCYLMGQSSRDSRKGIEINVTDFCTRHRIQ
jgi:hypothetical protein